MRPRLPTLLALLAAAALSLLGGLPLAAQSQSAPPSTAAPNEDPSGARVIVKYKALGALMRTPVAQVARGPQHASTLSQRHGLALADGRIVERHTQVVRGDKSLSSAALAARLAADPDVEYAVPDLRRHALAVPNDPLYAASASISPAAGQWYLRPPDATFVSAINAEGAWNLTTGAASIVVANIDTGVRFDHPDLANKLYPGYDFVNGDGDATDPGD